MYHGEKFNTWTHLIGALLALASTIWLVVQAAASGDGGKLFSVSATGTAPGTCS